MWNLICHRGREKNIVNSFPTSKAAKEELYNRIGLCYTLHADPFKIYSIGKGKPNVNTSKRERPVRKVRIE